VEDNKVAIKGLRILRSQFITDSEDPYAQCSIWNLGELDNFLLIYLDCSATNKNRTRLSE